jgi:hypothetical protein
MTGSHDNSLNLKFKGQYSMAKSIIEHVCFKLDDFLCTDLVGAGAGQATSSFPFALPSFMFPLPYWGVELYSSGSFAVDFEMRLL